MYKGYNQIFWGLIILAFSISINEYTILPPVIGEVMICHGILMLKKESCDNETRKAPLTALDKAFFLSVFLIFAPALTAVLAFVLKPWIIEYPWTFVQYAANLLQFYYLFVHANHWLSHRGSEYFANRFIEKNRFYILFSTFLFAVVLGSMIFYMEALLYSLFFFNLFFKFWLIDAIHLLRKLSLADLEPSYEEANPQMSVTRLMEAWRDGVDLLFDDNDTDEKDQFPQE